jgi:DNA-binding HxlR family transcriptional regulator
MHQNFNLLFKTRTFRTLGLLTDGPVRFNEIGRRVDVKNPRLLSQLLKKLCRDGIVVRTVIQAGPPAVVQYAITPLGRGLLKASAPLTEWLRDNATAVYAARVQREAHTSSINRESVPA